MRVTQVLMLGRYYPKFSCLGDINQVHPSQSLDVPCKGEMLKYMILGSWLARETYKGIKEL